MRMDKYLSIWAIVVHFGMNHVCLPACLLWIFHQLELNNIRVIGRPMNYLHLPTWLSAFTHFFPDVVKDYSCICNQLWDFLVLRTIGTSKVYQIAQAHYYILFRFDSLLLFLTSQNNSTNNNCRGSQIRHDTVCTSCSVFIASSISGWSGCFSNILSLTECRQTGVCCYIVGWPKVKVTLSDNNNNMRGGILQYSLPPKILHPVCFVRPPQFIHNVTRFKIENRL